MLKKFKKKYYTKIYIRKKIAFVNYLKERKQNPINWKALKMMGGTLTHLKFTPFCVLNN